MKKFVYLKVFYIRVVSTLMGFLCKPIDTRPFMLRKQDAALVVMDKADKPIWIGTQTSNPFPLPDILTLAFLKIFFDKTGTTNFREAIQDISSQYHPAVAIQLDKLFVNYGRNEVTPKEEDRNDKESA